MNKYFDRFQAWRNSRKTSRISRWKTIRAKGKARFVIRTALLYTLLMMLVLAIDDYLFLDGIRFLQFSYRVISYLFGGLVVGLVAWWIREGEYKNARLEDRIKAANDLAGTSPS